MINDFLAKEAEEHNNLVVQMVSGAQDAIDKWNKGEDELQAKLDAVVAQIEESKVHKEKLQAMINKCQEMKSLPLAEKFTKYMSKHLEETAKEMKEEINLADNFHNRTVARARSPQEVLQMSFILHPILKIL